MVCRVLPEKRQGVLFCLHCVVTLALSVVPVGYAEVLGSLGAKNLLAGEALNYPLDIQSPADTRIEVRLGDAPTGAKLVVDDDGVIFLRWQSDAALTGETVIEVIVNDVDRKLQLESQHLLIKAVESGVSLESQPIRLGPFERQILIAGEPWQWAIPVEPASVRLMVGGLPQGAFLTTQENPAHIVRWTPDWSQAGVHELRLLAVDVNNIKNVAEAGLVLVVDTPEGLADPDDPDKPEIVELPVQVISAGRILSLRVDSFIADGTKPVMQIDRLPSNASFEANDDGSYTFFWQTSDRSQGEHLFRLTAINPNETSLKAYREVLIVVGDPSLNQTLPVDLD